MPILYLVMSFLILSSGFSIYTFVQKTLFQTIFAINPQIHPQCGQSLGPYYLAEEIPRQTVTKSVVQFVL